MFCLANLVASDTEDESSIYKDQDCKQLWSQWDMVHQYKADIVASDTEDVSNIYKVESHAVRKWKHAFKTKYSRPVMVTVSSGALLPDVLFNSTRPKHYSQRPANVPSFIPLYFVRQWLFVVVVFHEVRKILFLLALRMSILYYRTK